MSVLLNLIDGAVGDALEKHPDYLTPKGKEMARRMIVRKVASALRDSMSAAKSEEAKVSEPEPTPASIGIKCWSKEWWALLFRKLDRNESVSFMMTMATRARSENIYYIKAEERPADNDLIMLTAFPSDSDAVTKWRPWLLAKGVRLPEWRDRMWLYLPAPEPPDKAA